MEEQDTQPIATRPAENTDTNNDVEEVVQGSEKLLLVNNQRGWQLELGSGYDSPSQLIQTAKTILQDETFKKFFDGGSG